MKISNSVFFCSLELGAKLVNAQISAFENNVVQYTFILGTTLR